MIPISDNIFFFGSRKPIVVYGLIILNLAVFILEIILESGNSLTTLVYNFGLVPAKISTSFLELMEGNLAAMIIIFTSFLSLLTAVFLHSSFSQILGNLIFLWVFGRTIEKIIGCSYFILIYFIACLITGIIQVVAEPSLTIPLVGSNGPVAAILGAYIFKFPNVKIYSVLPLVIIFIPVEIPAFIYMFWWFIQQVFYSVGSLDIAGGVNLHSPSYWMHGGGLIFGAAFISIFQRKC
ncbi:rhomboid family intramembrane serine protease [Richelia intracellularis]|uniref:rhomboid family intramembrane serine protease n=1 Tax=Richelia intracellularis TaxID=1164990 RepID=UPI000348EA0A|nr:rhomboid family intramembrane serine protease [Richelia intracellularis]